MGKLMENYHLSGKKDIHQNRGSALFFGDPHGPFEARPELGGLSPCDAGSPSQRAGGSIFRYIDASLALC